MHLTFEDIEQLKFVKKMEFSCFHQMQIYQKDVNFSCTFVFLMQLGLRIIVLGQVQKLGITFSIVPLKLACFTNEILLKVLHK